VTEVGERDGVSWHVANLITRGFVHSIRTDSGCTHHSLNGVVSFVRVNHGMAFLGKHEEQRDGES